MKWPNAFASVSVVLLGRSGREGWCDRTNMAADHAQTGPHEFNVLRASKFYDIFRACLYAICQMINLGTVRSLFQIVLLG